MNLKNGMGTSEKDSWVNIYKFGWKIYSGGCYDDVVSKNKMLVKIT